MATKKKATEEKPKAYFYFLFEDGEATGIQGTTIEETERRLLGAVADGLDAEGKYILVEHVDVVSVQQTLVYG